MIWLAYYFGFLLFWGGFAGFGFGGVSTLLAVVSLMALLGVFAKFCLHLRKVMNQSDIRGYTILGTQSILLTTLPLVSAFLLDIPSVFLHCDITLSTARIPCNVWGMDLGAFTLGLWGGAIFGALTLPIFAILAAVSFGYVIYAKTSQAVKARQKKQSS